MLAAKRVQVGQPTVWGAAPEDVPEGAEYVGGKRQRWSNPFHSARRGGLPPREAEEAVAVFRESLANNPEAVAAVRRELGGVDLACECALEAPCHADVLLQVANGEEP